MNDGERAWKRGPTLVVVGLLAAACASSSQLVLPASLREQADRYSVGGHVTALQRRLRFGPYTVTKPFIYKSDSHREATMFNGQQEHFESHQHGKFELQTGSGTFHARCEQALVIATQHDKSLQYQSVNGEGGLSIRDEAVASTDARIYGCAIGQPSGEELRLTRRENEDGLVEGANVHWALQPLFGLDDRPALATGLRGGFVVRDGEAVLGVVENSYESASVTIARGLDPQTRDRFAAVAAALLLLRDM